LPAAPSAGFGTISGELGLDNLQPGALVPGRARVQRLVAAEQFRVGRELFLRHAHEDMEMVTEDGVGKDLNPAEIGDLPELFAQNLLRRIVEDSFAVHRAGHAMAVPILF
jgi:hypothetical protein